MNIKHVWFISLMMCGSMYGNLYLELMKKCLINSIYQDLGRPCVDDAYIAYDPKIREEGKDWPVVAHTMIGMIRLQNLQDCVEDVLLNNIPGDLIETGVWRGGATIFMRAILKSYNETHRKVFVADSFAGLPTVNVQLYPADDGYNVFSQMRSLAVSLEEVQANFQRYDLLDDQVVFLKGWFKDTLPNAPIKRLAVMRLDGDLYESTMDALVNLYPKLSVGGYVIIDDWCIPCCRQAVEDFRRANNITDELCYTSDQMGAFWKRTK